MLSSETSNYFWTPGSELRIREARAVRIRDDSIVAPLVVGWIAGSNALGRADRLGVVEEMALLRVPISP
jgi:hypothetical protein